jgi:hypothetical protein
VPFKFLGLIIFILSSSLTAPAYGERPAANSPLLPYYDCMTNSVKRYARKTEKVDEAIIAAGVACQAPKDKIWTMAYLDFKQRGKTSEEAKRLSARVMEKIDSRFRPDLIKAALDAR